MCSCRAGGCEQVGQLWEDARTVGFVEAVVHRGANALQIANCQRSEQQRQVAEIMYRVGLCILPGQKFTPGDGIYGEDGDEQHRAQIGGQRRTDGIPRAVALIPRRDDKASQEGSSNIIRMGAMLQGYSRID